MKIKNTFLLAMSLFATVLFTISCDDDNSDTTPPVINLISPAEGAELLIGDAHGIHLDIDLSDNEMLSSYKIDIHNNFNNHDHNRSSEKTTVDFSIQRFWSISGLKNTKIHHHEIKIPENATPGNYHLMVYCTDHAGNESYVARSIVLSLTGESGGH